MTDEMTRSERFWLDVTNALYRVPQRVRAYQTQHPASHIHASGAAKGRRTPANSPVEYNVAWIAAQRATLLLSDENIICGRWQIALASIREARLTQIQGMSGRGLVLQIATDDSHYQFGLQYDPAWLRQTALPLTVEQGKLGISPLSLALRIITFGLLLWWLLDRLF